MSSVVLAKLLAMFVTVALGYIAARRRWLGRPEDGDAARMLGAVAFHLFVPALLFRTTARLDLAHMPWRTLAAFFVPALIVMFGVYLWQRRHAARDGAASPAVRAITAVFGNSVQVGIPFASALFGETGLAIHVTLVSLHALVLLSVLTALVELDLARAHHAQASGLARTLAQTARNTVIHPVVLPVVAGLLFNAAGGTLPEALDQALLMLASAVVPVCLVLIGVSLATYGVGRRSPGGLLAMGAKLFVLPAAVLGFAHWGLGLSGTPLAVVVMLAALPAGSNTLIFAQRYRTLEAEATGAIVVSTLAFALTAPLWLAVLGALGLWPAR